MATIYLLVRTGKSIKVFFVSFQSETNVQNLFIVFEVAPINLYILFLFGLTSNGDQLLPNNLLLHTSEKVNFL